MEKKLYETKGISKKHAAIMVAGSIFSVFGGIFFIFLSNMKRRGTMAYSAWGSGRIGGGYLLSDDGRRIFLILGIVAIVLGICYLIGLTKMQQSVFKIYEGHIEGVQYIPVLFVTLKREFNLEYSQISEVQLTKSFLGSVLAIVSVGGKYGVTLKSNGEKEVAYIKQKMKGTYR